ncbi:MAG: hypothetical protein DSM106950_30940 [Stigonema ocellatum SAG 48.90 = DSM 106950]|nr:hypothetical protein [Stigonema ocellatum SAG 48.90 = DSM 106950]
MQANESLSLFNELTAEESATISGGDFGLTPTTTGSSSGSKGGTTVNFDLNTYLFTIGAGAIFDGGITTNVVNIAFTRALFTQSN